MKEKPGNPKRQDDSPDNAPDQGGQDFDSLEKSVNQMVNGGKAARARQKRRKAALWMVSSIRRLTWGCWYWAKATSLTRKFNMRVNYAGIEFQNIELSRHRNQHGKRPDRLRRDDGQDHNRH